MEIELDSTVMDDINKRLCHKTNMEDSIETLLEILGDIRNELHAMNEQLENINYNVSGNGFEDLISELRDIKDVIENRS